jgi:hypothetical protein
VGIAAGIVLLVVGAALTWGPTDSGITLIGLVIFSAGLIRVIVSTIMFATPLRRTIMR